MGKIDKSVNVGRSSYESSHRFRLIGIALVKSKKRYRLFRFRKHLIIRNYFYRYLALRFPVEVNHKQRRKTARTVKAKICLCRKRFKFFARIEKKSRRRRNLNRDVAVIGIRSIFYIKSLDGRYPVLHLIITYGIRAIESYFEIGHKNLPVFLFSF